MVMYMNKKKAKFIERGEIRRDYRRKDLTPSDFLFPCDYEEAEMMDCFDDVIDDD